MTGKIYEGPIGDLIGGPACEDGLTAEQYLAMQATEKTVQQLHDEIDRLRDDCGQFYQVIGYLANYGKLDDDPQIIKALDNALAATEGEPRPHDDLLPFSVDVTENGQDVVRAIAYGDALDPEGFKWIVTKLRNDTIIQKGAFLYALSLYAQDRRDLFTESVLSLLDKLVNYAPTMEARDQAAVLLEVFDQ